MRRPLLVASAFTLALAAARVFGTPAISDPTGAALPAGLHLHFPALNLLLAPLFDSWDGISMLGMRQLRAFFIWSAVGMVVWRVTRAGARRSGARTLGGSRAPERLSVGASLLRETFLIIGGIVALGLFGLIGLVWHRPMVSIAGVPYGSVVVDLHTHTNVSHDVQGTLMNGFDAEAARRWHRRGGFDAFFITDHNRVDGIRTATLSADSTPTACPGEEVSAFDQHVVLLGNPALVDNRLYGDSLAGILRLFRDAGPKFGALAVASIPEYDKNHFGDLARFVDSGAAGFEIVNGAPKANELRTAHRDSVISLARRRNVFVDAVSDSHGWGATVEGWTLVKTLRGSGAPTLNASADRDDGASERQSTRASLCSDILASLRANGFSATTVVARHRLMPDAWWPAWLTPVGVIWEGWRSAGWLQLLGWLAWIWGMALVAGRRNLKELRGTP